MIGLVRVKPGCTEHFQIEEFSVTSGDAKIFNRQEIWSGSRRFIQPGTYIKLCGNGRSVIMSNTPAEIRDHIEVVEQAHGDVFIAGLGIGMVLEAILAKGDVVTSITVMEKEPEIISLVAPYYASEKKVSIILGNALSAFTEATFYPVGKRFDFLYFDIWDTICGDNYEEMKKLNRMYRSRKKKGAKTFFWCKDRCKKEHFASERYFRNILAPLGGAIQ